MSVTEWSEHAGGLVVAGPVTAPAGRAVPPPGPAEQVRQLGELATSVRGCRSFEVFERACPRVAALTGAAACSVVVREPSGRLLELARAGSEPGGRPASSDATVERLVALVARDGETALVPLPGEGERCALAVPVDDVAVLVLEFGPTARLRPVDTAVPRVAAAIVAEAARGERRQREEAEHEAAATAMRQLLEAGVRAGSPIEAAEALAGTAAKVLDFPVACAYLVDETGRISTVVTVGARHGRGDALRTRLVGQLASESPVWRRTVEGPAAGPDLIADTTVDGVVRPGGVAQVLGLRSMAAIPLLSSDGPLGLVLCGSGVPRRHWRRGVRELLAQLALEGAVVVDNARLREAERHEAAHDALTGLLNRRAFAQRIRQVLANARSTGAPAAVLLMDLDRFKEVNDHLGHHRGDLLLVDVAERLRSSMREHDVLARLGGDEFAVLLTSGASASGAEAVAAKIAEAMEQPFEVGDYLLHIDASVGVACFPDHAADADALLQRADVAMYSAKRSGRGHELYDAEAASRAADDLGLLGDLRRAVNEPDELLLHFQPKVDLADGHVAGVEALVRWRHPRLGLLGPDRFVPMAEETGLVRALTAWVVPGALEQLRRWQASGLDLRVAVNVSARDIEDRELATKLAGWLARTGVDGTSLVVEVTERTVMSERVAASGALQRLRDLGVQVSLDDFGSGYSSLAYLESLPVDEIKIDRQFLQLGRSRRSVIRSIIALGHDLDMRVVAEGVETAEHAEWLASTGCDEAQGYHFSRPLDPGAFEEWLADGVRDPWQPAARLGGHGFE